MKKSDFQNKLDEINGAFRVAKEKINAENRDFVLVPRELKDTVGQFNAGKPITGAELQKISENWRSKEPLIDEEGNAFVLFIPDFALSRYRRVFDSENLPRYHVAWCTTLENMQGAGRMKRYIKKSDIETNLFTGKNSSDNNTEAVLFACQHCRGVMQNKYGYDVYFDRKKMDLLKFFEKYGMQHNSDPGTTVPYSNQYPKHWKQISKTYREKANWICEQCNKSFEHDKYNLDVHHVNGVRSDVRSINLKVLCKKCHGEQPMHGHYKNLLESQGII